ncbi:glycine betaine/proline transport system substrate-binding protein [Streptomyces sp. Amel2xB2]|uniref:ABC transporter permease/substrate binding protein n=1 Tax=Streptomyces sp. Amel2xB2 TaxID=1305829 RepID=UPI000DBA6C39|nr:ABC transporter permease/substrate binding protein [Streptomyces sp. Amel2xB2]RAJ68762.1 glycine betaine/proline transport system substrate-binding protein [Streptomyces sp. Amel2xB2]
MPRFDFGSKVESLIDWLQTHLTWLFDAISAVLTNCFDGVNAVLGAPEPLLMGGILAVVTFWLRGLLPALLAMLGFMIIDSVELWDNAMMTLSMVLVCAVITLIIAVPVGIWASRSKAVSTTVRPVLDFMQTMPAMIYLLPGVVFFGVGVTPGLLATVIFSMPPAVRMTELGIRQVDSELVEAAEAFGTTPGNTLRRVQLPLALPTIMAGVNQVIMLALSMVVIAGMAGASGLGEDVYNAVTRVEIGAGFEAGLAVVILAMYLDRMTAALNQRVSPLGRRALAKAAAMASGWKLVHYRPNTAVAGVGIIVLALVAGGMNMAGGDGASQAGGTNVGKGKQIKMGYIPWDEGIASSYLWKEVLEQRGYKPTLQQLDPGPMFTALSKGDLDFQTDTWLPTTHEQYWKKYGKKLEDFGQWYGPTSLELSVPSYVKGVKSLDDLKANEDKFGKKIIGIEASSGEMGILKDKIVKEYGLSDWKIVSSSTASMLSELDRSYKSKKPIVTTLWSPHWAYSKYDLTKLKDPKGAWGKGDKIHTVARKGFSNDDPRVASWLKNFKMNEKDLTELEGMITDAGKGKEQDAVKKWLKKHPGLVDKMAPVSGGGNAKGKDAGKAVNLGYFPWDEAIATTYLWENILEDRGYKPKVQQLDPGPLYTALSKGDMDVQFDAWLPTTHKQYMDKYGDKLTDVGKWYGPTSLELSVPSYMKDVKSLDDLKKHKGEFKGKIIGIEASAGEMGILKDKVVKEYGLEDWKIVSSSTASMMSELDRSIKKKEPVVVTLWTPHWAYAKYDLTKLKDPKGAWGKGDDIHITGKKTFGKDFPELNTWLKKFKMSEKDLASLEAEIQKGGQGKEKESARKWMDAHPGLVDKLAPVK